MLKFRGKPGGIWITLDPEADDDLLLAEFAKTLETRVSFLASGDLFLDTGSRPLKAALVSGLLAVTDRLGLRVRHFGGHFAEGASDLPAGGSAPGDRMRGAGGAEDPRVRHRPEPLRLASAKAGLPPRSDQPARILHKSLRNGQEVNSPGDLVILGDVNAGATVRAGGDILIIGALRGVAHAGFNGDARRVIYAGTFAPTQVRIANILAASPGRVRTIGPEMARCEGGQIVVESWPHQDQGALTLPSAFYRPRREVKRRRHLTKEQVSSV